MAEIGRIHYEIEYTEGISQRMRIPEKLQVAPSASDDLEAGPVEAPSRRCPSQHPDACARADPGDR